MSVLTFRGLFVLVCVVGFLASQPFKVSGLIRKDLALRFDEGQLPFLRSFRMLKYVAMEDVQSKMDLASTSPMTFDPNQSSKRTFRKGSEYQTQFTTDVDMLWLCPATMLRNDKRIPNAKTK